MKVTILYSTCITDDLKGITGICAHASRGNDTIMTMPTSDGGRGFLDAIEVIHPGSKRVAVTVRDCHMQAKDTYYLVSHNGKTAYIEAYKICGIDPNDPRRNPAMTFTHGVGDAIAHAFAHGCRNFVIAAEQVATIDGGAGMLQALGYKILTADGNELPSYRGAEMLRARSVVDSVNALSLKRCRFSIACNDDSAFYADTGPAKRYAANLGANEVTTDILDNGLRNMASVYFKHNNRDISYIKGGGAGGGIAGALASFFNAKLKSTVATVPEEKRLNAAIEGSDALVIMRNSITPAAITGLTLRSLLAKIQKAGLPAYCIARHVENAPLIESMGITDVITSSDPCAELPNLLKHLAHKKSD